MPKHTRKNPNGGIGKWLYDNLPLHKRTRKKAKKPKKKGLLPYKRNSPNKIITEDGKF